MEYKTDYFSPIDLYIGKFLDSLTFGHQPDLRLAASLISRNLRDGHVCLNLREYASKNLDGLERQVQPIVCPDLSSWVETLKKDSRVGMPGEFKPLILDGQDRLYFHRYWQYEQDIADFIRQRLSLKAEIVADREIVREKLKFYFPEMDDHEMYWPAVAALSALLNKFLVITGSPGTGKTTTIARILALLNDVSGDPERIALCAPTGKAAQRLEESVRRMKIASNWTEKVKKSIPDEASTVHRLLRSIRFSPYFQHDENNPLPYDTVVVDESSMVDLPLMAKLMKSISKKSRLILLGDKDQLASVEAGAVLGSICFPVPLNEFSNIFEKRISEICGKQARTSDRSPGVQDCIIELKQNYRFTDDSGLNMLSRAVKNMEWENIELLVSNQSDSDIQFHTLHRTKKMISDMIAIFVESYREYLEAAVEDGGNPEKIFEMFERFQILCAMRIGIWGVEQINRLLEKSFADLGLIHFGATHYEGQPVMVVQNNYQMKLFNGDIGIILRDQTNDKKLKACFRDKTEGIRKIALEKLPSHETVWAMTVHKSQGSEFDRIALILSDADNPVLTKELVYTGITRARFSAGIWANHNILRKAIKNPITRHSGLTDALM